MEGLCPNLYTCKDGYAAINSNMLLIQDGAGLISSSLSVVRSTIILLAYCAFEDLRKGAAQKMTTLLALADLGTALGCLLGIANYFSYYFLHGTNSDKSSACRIFYNIKSKLPFSCGVALVAPFGV